MNRPLDKQEAILYGQFVNAAYAMFKRDRTLLRPAPGDIPEPYELVAWLNMSDFTFWGQEIPKFYGIIGRHREQKHSFVLAIRGTEGWVEWLDDAVVRLVPFRQVPHAGRVSRGFDKIYSTLKVVKRHVGAEVAPAAMPSAAPAAAPPPEVMAGSFAEQLEQLADTLEEPGVQEQMRITKKKTSSTYPPSVPSRRRAWGTRSSFASSMSCRWIRGASSTGRTSFPRFPYTFRCFLITNTLRRPSSFPLPESSRGTRAAGTP